VKQKRHAFILGILSCQRDKHGRLRIRCVFLLFPTCLYTLHINYFLPSSANYSRTGTLPFVRNPHDHAYSCVIITKDFDKNRKNFSFLHHLRLKLRYLDYKRNQHFSVAPCMLKFKSGSGRSLLLTPKNKKIKLEPIKAIKMPRSLQRLSNVKPRGS
jgi:hypothetical protein